MATRVPDWNASEGTSGVPVATRVAPVESHVTPAAIDTALAAVERDFGLSQEVAGGLRRLLSADYTSGVARAYYGALAHRGLQYTQLRAMRKALTIPYALDDAAANALAAYAPDFKLAFRNTDHHDHPVYAAQRMIDQIICESRVPPGCRASDIGGSSHHHARKGNLNWHVCNPLVDRKDPTRQVLARLSHRRLSEDASVSASTREYSRRFLAGDPEITCGKRAQDCTYQSDVAIAVHVYDIPMEDWVGIMERKGLQLVEGCVLFSTKLFHERQGMFPSAGIRYECDVARDTYAMGFVGSPAWWYRHSLREHLRYGVDQVLYGEKATYSYKVVERRGDTIFFRIIKIDSRAEPNQLQVYRLPGVPMVTVEGLEISVASVGRRLTRQWHWPEPLWSAMVLSAVNAVERGTYNVDEQFNKYRSIAPRQTINAVRVAGGYSAALEERVALVIYSSLEAVAVAARQRAAFAAIVENQERLRRREQFSGYAKFFEALCSVAYGTVTFVCEPLKRLFDFFVKDRVGDVYDFYSSAPRVTHRLMPAEVVLTKSWHAASTVSVDVLNPVFRERVLPTLPADYITAAPASAAVARVVVDLFGDVLDQAYRSRLPALEDASTVVTEGLSDTAVDNDATKPVEMEAAIAEAIAECELEAASVEASCIRFRDECMIGGQPDVAVLHRKKEEMLNPDFWYISKGVVSHSILGRSGDDFDLSAVLLPMQSGMGSFVHPVRQVVFEGDSKGRHVVREHSCIDDVSFTGWAFANNSLSVYNGPEIVRSMSEAMKLIRPLKVTLRRGPAGCGKTTTIVASLRPSEVVLCPAKASVLETRGRIRATRKDMAFKVMERCRTIDSYLVNVLQRPDVRALRADVLRGDEAFMTRSGKWYACALLLRADELYVYGDAQQIPHVPRALCPQLHLKLTPSVVASDWITYRCPHDALAAVGDLYDWQARSASRVERSLSILPAVDAAPVPDGCVMMCMYQDDKKAIRQLYKSVNVPIRVMTVHEAQGNTFEHVRLHRFIRGKNQTHVPDAFDLFQKDAYVLVAMTRHTHSFAYYTQMGADNVTRRIEQGGVASRVAAAAHVKSAGESMEHLRS